MKLNSEMSKTKLTMKTIEHNGTECLILGAISYTRASDLYTFNAMDPNTCKNYFISMTTEQYRALPCKTFEVNI